MSNIDELQRRITAAMDRVAEGLDKIGGTSEGGDAELSVALEEERTANAQLSERVRTLKARGDEETAKLRAQVEQGASRMAQLDVELQRVRAANSQLTNACDALREANQEGVGDAHLINKSMLAELEALRAVRAADVAQNSAIIDALVPLLDDAGKSNEEAS